MSPGNQRSTHPALQIPHVICMFSVLKASFWGIVTIPFLGSRHCAWCWQPSLNGRMDSPLQYATTLIERCSWYIVMGVPNREWLILLLSLRMKASQRRCLWSRALKNESKTEVRGHSRTKKGMNKVLDIRWLFKSNLENWEAIGVSERYLGLRLGK